MGISRGGPRDLGSPRGPVDPGQEPGAGGLRDAKEGTLPQGLAGSLTALATMYEEGRGVARDPERARELYRRAGFDETGR